MDNLGGVLTEGRACYESVNHTNDDFVMLNYLLVNVSCFNSPQKQRHNQVQVVVQDSQAELG